MKDKKRNTKLGKYYSFAKILMSQFLVGKTLTLNIINSKFTIRYINNETYYLLKEPVVKTFTGDA